MRKQASDPRQEASYNARRAPSFNARIVPAQHLKRKVDAFSPYAAETWHLPVDHSVTAVSHLSYVEGGINLFTNSLPS